VAGGIDFSPELRHVGTPGAPVVRLEFDRPMNAVNSDQASQSGLLDMTRVVFENVDWRLLSGGHASFGVDLTHGRHELPLTDGPGFVVEVADGTVAAGAINVGIPARSTSNEPILKTFEVEFSPALKLVNVLQTLSQAQRLFEDPRLTAIFQTLSRLAGSTETGDQPGFFSRLAQGGPAMLVDWVQKGLSSRGLDGGVILLSGIRGTARFSKTRRCWEIHLAFSGEIRLFDRVSCPFADVELPEAAVPALHGALKRLISHNPLSSGRLHGERARTPDLIRSLLALVSSASVKGMFDVRSPKLDVGFSSVDRTHHQMRVSMPGPFRVKGRIEVRRDHDGWDIATERLAVAFPKQGDKSLGLSLKGHADIDFATPGLQIEERVRGDLSMRLLDGSVLPFLEVALEGGHPLANSGLLLQTRFDDVHIQGGSEASWASGRLELSLASDGLSFGCSLGRTDPSKINRSQSEMSISTLGTLSGSLIRDAEGLFRAQLGGDLRLVGSLVSKVTPIPELKLDDGNLTGGLEADVRLACGATIEASEGVAGFRVIPSGGLEAILGVTAVELGGRRVTLPRGTRLNGTWRRGQISEEGLEDMALDLSWDLAGGKCLLHGNGRTVSLLTRDLRKGELTALLGPGGRLMFSGEKGGLYGVRFFNALINPTDEPKHLLEILESEDALGHVAAALELFNPDLARVVSRFQEWLVSARAGLKTQGIQSPGDVVPMNRIARIISLSLMGDASLEDRIMPLVRRVADGRGLDVVAAGQILREAFQGRRWDYEIDGIVRWLNLVLSPSEPLLPKTVVEEMPLVEQYRDSLADIPSGTELVEAVQAHRVTAHLLDRLNPYVTDLTLAQIDGLLEAGGKAAHGPAFERFLHVADIKRKVAKVEEWNGQTLTARSLYVASFLGEAVGPLSAFGDDPATCAWPPPCAMGARDAAILVQAGLAQGLQGLQSQINNRMLLELVRSRPGEFLREILVEMGQFVPRILSGVLYAFLNQDQDELRDRLDLVALMEEKLGTPVPRRRDFMAGGRRAGESYFDALSKLAVQIFDDAGPYLARRAWIREHRHPLPGPRADGREVVSLQREAQRAIASADAMGTALDFDGRATVSRKKAYSEARTAYEEAFSACRAFLSACPGGFERPWLKAFWARNEEALKVLSVVRNVQQDCDDVRQWFRVMAGQSPNLTEQRLLNRVVDVLYAKPNDRQEVLVDPLVRLLIDPEDGEYDFTIVSCMGVITDGDKGRELEDAYRRLAERRGVKVVRAPTGLFWPLEQNAAAILKSIGAVQGPWGFVGYSQGCANALLAEAFLLGGSPVQQRLLDGLVCRNMLFSANNGSAHGTSGALKFARAVVEGEMFLKHYQAGYSRELIELALRVFRRVVDSKIFINSLGGACSLTVERARILHRDGQFVPEVPTSTTRGMITPEAIPEALEYLYFVHKALVPGADCDSQIVSDEALGHATRVRNPWTEVLTRSEIPSRIQIAHHWTPITAEIEIVTTDRDRERAVYMAPKDRLVFPWVEVNARFGRIRRKGQ